MQILTTRRLRLLLTCCGLGLLAPAARAQAPTWTNAVSGTAAMATGSVTSQIKATATDASGNVYVTGFYNGTGGLTLGNTLLPTPAGGSGNDIFVAKWSPTTSNWVWAYSAGGTGFDQGLGIAVNGSAVYITGVINNDNVTASFPNGTNKVSFGATNVLGASATATSDMFVAKYTDAGTSAALSWVQVGGGTGSDQGNGIAVNAAGTGVYVTGPTSTNSTNTTGVKFGSTTQPTGFGSGATANNEIFLAKYDASGTYQWAVSAGGTSGDIAFGVAVSGSSVYVTGYTNNNTLAGGNTNAVTLRDNAGTTPIAVYGTNTTANTDVFVAKYVDSGSSTATATWARTDGGSSGDQGNGIAANGTAVYVVGQTFVATVAASANGTNPTFGGVALAGTSPVVPAAANQDAFVARYTDNTGTVAVAWARAAGGSVSDGFYGVAVSGTAVYVAGFVGNFAPNGNNVAFSGNTGSGSVNGSGTTTNQEAVTASYTDNTTTVGFNWANSGGGTVADIAYGVAVGGTTVYSGLATGSTGPIVFGTGAKRLATANSAVLGRQTASTGAWLGTESAVNGGSSFVRATATDASGNVYVTGYFTTAVIFGSTTLVNNNSNNDIFVAKYSPGTGTWLWAVSGGGLGSDQGLGIAVSGSAVYVTGFIANNYFDVNAVQLAGVPLPGEGGGPSTATDIFVARFNAADGSLAWAQAAGGNGNDQANGIAANGSSLYLTGLVTNDNSNTNVVVFGGTPAAAAPPTGATTLNGASGTNAADLLVAKYTDNASSASFNWARAGGGTGADQGNGIALSPDGASVYATGLFTSATGAQFGTQALTGAGLADVVTLKYDNAGTFGWASSGGGSGADQGNGIAATAAGVYVTGAATNSGTLNSTSTQGVAFGSVALNSASTTATANTDAFVVKYTPAGAATWATAGGGTGADTGLAVAASGPNVYATGSYTQNGTTSTAAQFGGTAAPATGTGTNTNVFVTATTDNGPTAAPRWLQTGGGGGNDIPNAIAVFGNTLTVGGSAIPNAAAPATFGTFVLANPVNGTINFLGRLIDNAAVPALTAVAATSGTVGSVVALTGTNLTGTTTVTFTGASGNTVTTGFVASADGTTLTNVTVPSGATTGNITVTTTTGNTSNGIVFTVNGATALVVSTGSLASPTAIPGGAYTSITITGTGVGQFSGPVSVSTGVDVQPGGLLLTNCQALTGAGSFALQAGATLGICDAAGISATALAGAVQVTGTRSYAAGASYLYNGTVAQSTGDGLPGTVQSLTVNNSNSVTLAQALAVRELVRLQSGNLNGGTVPTINPTNNLTLLSTPGFSAGLSAGRTALIDNTGGAVTGAANVMQRAVDNVYTGDNIGYHHFSSPMMGTTLNDLGDTPGFVPQFDPGSFNTTAAVGYVRPFPTVLGYNETRVGSPQYALDQTAFNQGYFAPLGTDTWVPGKAYAVNSPNAVTLDFTGQFNNAPTATTFAGLTGLTRGPNADAGWQLLGNPFPSPLNFGPATGGAAAFNFGTQTTNLDGSIYQYHATSRYGGYFTTYQGASGLGVEPQVPAGGGFFMRVTNPGTNGELRLSNANRVTSYTTQPSFGRATASTRPTLRLELAGAGQTDAAYLYFAAQATAGTDAQYDAIKLANPNGLNLALVAGSTTLAIDGRPAPVAATVLPLHLTVPAAGSYVLTAADLTNFAATPVYLRDALLGARTLLAPGTAYRFTTAATGLSGRFALELAPAGAALASATQALAAQVQLYPNPTAGRFHVVLPAGAKAASAVLTNALGQVVLNRTLTGNEADFSLVTPGVYSLHLTVEGHAVTRKIVVE